MHPWSDAASKDVFAPPFLEKRVISWPQNAPQNLLKSGAKTISKNESDFRSFGIPKTLQKSTSVAPKPIFENHCFTCVKPMFLRFGPLWKTTFSPLETRPRKGNSKTWFPSDFGTRFWPRKRVEKQSETRLVFRRYANRPRPVAN